MSDISIIRRPRSKYLQLPNLKKKSALRRCAVRKGDLPTDGLCPL